MISIKRQLVGAAVGSLGLAAMAGFIVPISAAQAAIAHPAAKGPHTNIVGSPAKFVPNKLTVKPVTGKCSATNNSFSGTNETTKTQVVQVKGMAPTTFKPGQTHFACAPPSAKGVTVKAKLKSSGAVLTIKVT